MKKVGLILLVILAFGLRLYRINNPLADWHSWRQADTAAVSRNFIQEDFDLLHPKFDDLSNVASGQENPEGYRFVEFPVYNLFHAVLAKAFPKLSLETWGRLISVFFSLGSLVFLYLIVRLFVNQRTAFLAAFFFVVLPFNVYYSRVILPEPMMVFTSLGMLWSYAGWTEKNNRQAFGGIKYLALAVIFAAVSFLLKPYALVLLIPIAYLIWEKWRFNGRKWLAFLFSCFLALLPFLWWRGWMRQFPEGIPAYEWLFNKGGIRFKGAWFYWLFAERLAKLILGYWGMIFFGFGLVTKTKKKEGWFFLSWLAAIGIYLAVIAGGNVRHDYYQIIAVPIVCVYLAKGVTFLLDPSRDFRKLFTSGLSLVTLVFMLAFSWYQVRDFYHLNNPLMIKAGRVADQLLPKDAKVIAPYGGDTAFLYQVNRSGWPVGVEIEKMIKLGATHYVNFNFGPETEWVTAHYCTIKRTADYLIVDLQRKCP
jgi:4-amino-4-deoxy-L-arabinose transferase-like glycosyltransferase